MDRLEDIILIMHRNPHFVFTFDHSHECDGFAAHLAVLDILLA